MAKELDKTPTLIAVTKKLLIPHDLLIDGVKYSLNPSNDQVPKFWADAAVASEPDKFYFPKAGEKIDTSDHPKKDIQAGKGIEQIFKLLPEVKREITFEGKTYSAENPRSFVFGLMTEFVKPVAPVVADAAPALADMNVGQLRAYAAAQEPAIVIPDDKTKKADILLFIVEAQKK